MQRLKHNMTNEVKFDMVTAAWNKYRNGFSYPVNKYLYLGKPAVEGPTFTDNEMAWLEEVKEFVEDQIETMTKRPAGTVDIKLNKAVELYINTLNGGFILPLDYKVLSTTATKLYRGISESASDIDKFLKTNMSFLSTSTSRDIAIQHARSINNRVETKSFIIEYTFDAGIPMIDMNVLGEDYMMMWQQEFVLPVGLKFKLTGTGTHSVAEVKSTRTIKKKVGRKIEESTVEDVEPAYTIPFFEVHVSASAKSMRSEGVAPASAPPSSAAAASGGRKRGVVKRK